LDAVALASAANFQNGEDQRIGKSRRAEDGAGHVALPDLSLETGPTAGKPVVRRKYWLAFPLAVLLVLCALAWRTGVFTTPQHLDHAMAVRNAIAVLPFADLNENPAPWLAEAVTRDVITDLARVPNLLVISGVSEKTQQNRRLTCARPARNWVRSTC
jgi:hypothetical protein